MALINIGKVSVGSQHEPFIIAEAGINHNGSLELARKMIKLAKNAGADAVKFQTFKADDFINDPDITYTYKSQGQEITESMLQMFRRYEFNEDEWLKVKQFCEEEDILFLSTPQNESDLKLLLEIGIPAIKVGSDDFNNLPLLKAYSETGLPLLMSCGMADLAEVYQSLYTVGALDGYPAILLLCTSQYPTPPGDVNIRKLRTLADAFPMVPMGFSDHTRDLVASVMAVAMGAVLFEKHFTLDNNLPGPDHWFSESPQGLESWIKGIRTAYKMLGSGIVRPTNQEDINRKDFRRVITAARDIKTGEYLTKDSLAMLRVKDGLGLPPTFMQYLVGKKAWKDMHKGEPIEI